MHSRRHDGGRCKEVGTPRIESRLYITKHQARFIIWLALYYYLEKIPRLIYDIKFLMIVTSFTALDRKKFWSYSSSHILGRALDLIRT